MITQRRTAAASLAALVLVLMACGSESGAPESAEAPAVAPPGEPGAPAQPPSPGVDTTPPAPSQGCTGKEALTGDVDWTVPSNGRDRIVHVHVPVNVDPTKPVPVVLNFHGYSSNATEQALLSGMKRKADEVGFVAVHPEGVGTTQSWNAGACCGDAAQQGVDDVAFVSTLLDTLEQRLCVDTRRVFATGMSNGGFLSHRLACELGTRVAAVAPVAGVLGIPSCAPVRPVPVMQFHGTLDALVPYTGSTSLGFPSVPDTMSAWAKRDGCAADPTTTFDHGDTKCVTYAGCSAGAEVGLCTVTGGGHTWPGGVPVPTLGYTTLSIRATDAMWEFFQKHPMP